MSLRRTVHDPEVNAAEYVSGELRGRSRLRFEEHLLDCEDCWREVRVGRTGRRLAEGAREIAPPGLKDDVRASIMLSGGRPRPGRGWIVSALAVFLAAAVGFGGLLLVRRSEQPTPIAAALASYRANVVGAIPAEHRAPDLSAEGLRLTGSGQTALGDMPADTFMYRSGSGERIVVFLSSEAFPQAANASERSGSLHGWHAQDGGLSLVCGDRPVSYLLIGENTPLLRLVDQALNVSDGALAG